MTGQETPNNESGSPRLMKAKYIKIKKKVAIIFLYHLDQGELRFQAVQGFCNYSGLVIRRKIL